MASASASMRDLKTSNATSGSRKSSQFVEGQEKGILVSRHCFNDTSNALRSDSLKTGSEGANDVYVLKHPHPPHPTSTNFEYPELYNSKSATPPECSKKGLHRHLSSTILTDLFKAFIPLNMGSTFSSLPYARTHNTPTHNLSSVSYTHLTLPTIYSV